MSYDVGRAERFQSWPASITLFAIATVGEFFALAGWYLFHHAHPPLASNFYDAADWLVKWFRAAPLEHPDLAGTLQWAGGFFQSRHVALAVGVLWAGFIVERAMVVLWLKLPKLVFTPGGNLHRRWVVIGAVTVAEIIVWVVWIAVARRSEPAFAAAILVFGIHLVHSYEVAVLKQSPLRPVLSDPGVVGITVLEAVGGVTALSLAARGKVLWPLVVIFAALLIEHLLQVFGLKQQGARAS